MATFRILSLDGGGIRGLLTATFLEHLDRTVPGWRDRIDLIAGTSTGGILALGLAYGLSPTDLRRLYYDKGKVIFKDSFLDDVLDLGKVVGAEYSNKGLRAELKAIFAEAKLKDLPTHVLIPTFDLDNEDANPCQRHWKAKFFHNIPGHDSDGEASVVDVALYTSAAPTYFPSVNGYIDGGVVANNPSMAALAQTQDTRAYPTPARLPDDIRLLSLGTGEVNNYVKGTKHDWGFGQWARPLVQLMLDGIVNVPHFQCLQLLGLDRYHRLTFTFPAQQAVGLDEYNKRDYLVSLVDQGRDPELNKRLAEATDWLKTQWMA